ncbi:MAG: cupin domain-containing protein [Vicinamibacterales bacterium]
MATDCTRADIEHRLVRYSDLKPCRNAFVDSRSPGSEAKENFTIVGPGVSENPDQHVHIAIPHGFNIGGARQPPGCLNSQHSHDTAEVFIVHSGRWAFRSGERAQDGEVILTAGDTISLPIHMFRGFENIGDDVGFLFAVLGGDDPGRVTWAPQVFDLARHHGLVLMQNGRLVDTVLGQTAPAGVAPMQPTSWDEVARMRRVSAEDLEACVQREADLPQLSTSALGASASSGQVHESPIIGEAGPEEGLPAGRMNWPHGFHLRRLALGPAAAVPFHIRIEEEVLLMHRGTMRLRWGAESLDLHAGDALTVPKDLPRHYSNPATEPALVYVVRGGNHPEPPRFSQ